MSSLKVGMIGLGKMGELHFLNALHSEGVRVVAAADASASARKTAEKYHVKVYDDYEKLIESEELDAVVISLPNFLKKDSIVDSIEKGLNIFVDKPLARNLSEAEEIVGKAKAENVRLMVGVNYRYFDSVKKIKTQMDEGRVGDIVIATSELIMDGPFSHSLVPKPVPEWWLDKEKAGGGALLDLGYHLLDILNWFFGPLEVEFSALGYRFCLPVEDSATVVLRSSGSGLRCVVNVGWFSKMIFPDFNFRTSLHGTVGYVTTEQSAPKNLYLHAAKEGTLNVLRNVAGRKVKLLSYTYYYASFAEILNEFFESIRNDAQLPVSLEEQLAVMKIIDSIYRQKEVSQ